MRAWAILGVLFLISSSSAVGTRVFIETHEVIVKKGEVHQGHRFPEGTVLDVAKDGAIYYVTLGDDHRMGKHLIKKGTKLYLGLRGNIFQLWSAPGQVIEGILLEHPGTWVTFDDEGQLQYLVLTTPQTVRGYRLIHHVEFHPSGSLKKGLLSEDQLATGLYLKGKTAIEHHPSGKVMQATVSRQQQVAGYEVEGESPFVLFPDGRLKAAILAAEAQVRGISCIGPISFYETGAPHYVTLARDQVVRGKGYKEGEGLNLSKSGDVLGWRGARKRDPPGYPKFLPPE